MRGWGDKQQKGQKMKSPSILTLSILTATTLSASAIHQGWQILGATEDITTNKFNDSCVEVVWKYDSSDANNPKWQVYVPNSDTANPNGYSKYDAIDSIKKAEGFWVLGNSDCELDIDTAVETNETINYEYSLHQNWQLLGAVIDVRPFLFEKQCADFMWTYDTSNGNDFGWKLHILNEEIEHPDSIKKFNLVERGQGFWVHADSDCKVAVSTQLPPEPYQKYQWYIDDGEEGSIHPGNYLNKYTGKGITIVVIEVGGVDTKHEDLLLQTTWETERPVSVKIEENGTTKYILKSEINQKDIQVVAPEDENSSEGVHGTSVVGLINGQINGKGIRGVAPDANVHVIRFNNGSGKVSAEEIIVAFDKAVELGADVISCSWGNRAGEPVSVREKIINAAKNSRNGKGAVVVFSAGNDDIEVPIPDEDDFFQEAITIPEVIAVGATKYDSNRADYSDYGATLDIVAPGGVTYFQQHSITTLDLMGERGVGRIDENYRLDDVYIQGKSEYPPAAGTSLATPIVAASAALMLQANPNLTSAQVQEILKLTADKVGDEEYIDDGNGSTRNDYYGYGKINLSKAIEMAEAMR